MNINFLKVFTIPTVFSMLICASARAQETVTLAPDAKVGVMTNPFRQNWEVSLGIQGLSFYSNQENDLDLPGNPFKGFRTNAGLSAAVTKWFSPEIAMRTRLAGFWGRSVSSNEAKENAVKYFTLQEHVVVNISDILRGYDAKRRLQAMAYGGAGMARVFSFNENSLVLSLGLMADYRLTDRLKVYGDLGLNICGDDFDAEYAWSANIFKDHDRWLALELGLTLQLGQNKWKRAVDLDDIKVVPWDDTVRELTKAYNDIDDLSEQVEKLKKQPANVITNNVTNTVSKFPNVSVFFEIGSYELNHKGQLVNVKKLVEAAKAENRIITVAGYADSQTGNPADNEILSARRADTIVKELVKMGVKQENIRIVNGGGVDTLNPVPANRRVVISLE